MENNQLLKKHKINLGVMKGLNIMHIALLMVALIGCKNKENKAVAQSEPIEKNSIKDYINHVDLSAGALDSGEYDFRLGILTSKEQSDKIKSIKIVFPDGRSETIPKEENRILTKGVEHLTNFGYDAEFKAYVWSYAHIGATDLSNYGSGIYTVVVYHDGGSQEIEIPFMELETENPLEQPPFPKLVSPDKEGDVSSPVTFAIEPSTKYDAALFLGLEDPDSEDFKEEVMRMIPASTSTTEPIPLKPGRWGGDIGYGISYEGTTDGVSWQVGFSAATEFDLEIK